MPRSGPARMHADSRMSRHVETDDPMRSIRAVRVGRMAMWCGRILNRIASVLKMSQGRVTIHVVVSRPCSYRVAVRIIERNLMRCTVKYQTGHTFTFRCLLDNFEKRNTMRTQKILSIPATWKVSESVCDLFGLKSRQIWQWNYRQDQIGGRRDRQLAAERTSPARRPIPDQNPHPFFGLSRKRIKPSCATVATSAPWRS